jgi:hypothetical protein
VDGLGVPKTAILQVLLMDLGVLNTAILQALWMD